MITRNAIASVAQTLVSALIMFFLYRVVLDVLGAERLGIWAVVLATASASRIAELGISASVTRFIAKYRSTGNGYTASHIIQTACLSIAGILSVILLLIYPLLEKLFEHIFEEDALGEALVLLPYALASLILATIAGVFQAGLDGCQRYDWRAILVIAGQLLFLGVAIILMQHYGLVGLAWAQIGQCLLLLIGGWLLIRRTIRELPLFPYQWRKESFREMLNYGAQYQVGSFALMLFDPLTKALLGKYGGMEAAGYYQMASQLVSKVRSVISSANQVIVPLAAGVNVDSNRLKDIYRTNLKLLNLVIFPLYALVSAYTPLVSELWIGQYEPLFGFFSTVLVFAWAVRTLADPAYFLQLGTGRIVWITAGNVAMGVTNMAIGFSLGPYYGTKGVMFGMAVGFMVGGVVIIAGWHKDQRLSWKLLIPKESISLIICGLLAAICSNYYYHLTSSNGILLRYILGLSLPLIIVGAAVWFHPLRPVIQGRIVRRTGISTIL